jgi:hypothetical protein
MIVKVSKHQANDRNLQSRILIKLDINFGGFLCYKIENIVSYSELTTIIIGKIIYLY